MSARDAAIANVGRKRRRGAPKRYDGEIRLMVDEDLDRRVRSYAAVEDISTAQAWRTLATLALDEMEK